MTRLWKRLFLLAIPLILALLGIVAGRMAIVGAVETTVAQDPSAAHKVVHGMVQTTAQHPVQNALVIAHRVDRDESVETLTGADSAYELGLSPGLWAIAIKPLGNTVPGQWIYPFEPQHVEFHHNDEPEKHRLNFTVRVADAAATGRVEMPDGDVPPFTVSVGLRNGEGLGGRTNIDPASGAFKLALPTGRYDVIVHPQHEGYAAPNLEPVNLLPGETVDLGTITLLARDATITGTVTDNSGAGVEGIPVTAWQRGHPHVISRHTGSNGLYALAVTSGTWHIQPAPGPDMPYFYLGRGETVEVTSGETIGGVDFELLATDAVIAGYLATEDGRPIQDVSGWAIAVNSGDPNIHNGGPIHEGRFRIHIPGGAYLVSVRLPPGSPYLAPDAVPASVEPGETVTISIPLKKKDASITGVLVDPRSDRRVISGVNGTVSAQYGDRWATTHIQPDAGTYALAVTAGIWHLTYDIDDPEYVKLGGAANIPLQTSQTVHWPLPITRNDAGIAGQVLSPDGKPVPGAVVFAQGLVGEIHGLRILGRTDENGHFRTSLPHGRYRVGAINGREGWINPIEQIVGVEPNTIVDDVSLQFHEPNARIGGKLTVLNTQEQGRVAIWAWSERGGFTQGQFPVTQTDPGGQAVGPYHLGILSGATWHVVGVFETEDAFWIGRERVEVIGTNALLDLEISGPNPKPPPVVVTFVADRAQQITLADGTDIFIPAGALPVEGRVTLRIVPIATLPYQRDAQITRFGYAFFATDESGQPVEEHFNHNVVIRFHYDDHDLIDRDYRIKPAYFSTSTNEWTFPEHFIMEPDRNTVTMEIDHFTNFALVESSAITELFLPVTLR